MGQLLALCKELGKTYIKKNSIGSLKNRHLLISDVFLKKPSPFKRWCFFLKIDTFLKVMVFKPTPFKRKHVGLDKSTLISVGFA